MVHQPSLYATATMLPEKIKVQIGIDPQLSNQEQTELLDKLIEAAQLEKSKLWQQSSITFQF